MRKFYTRIHPRWTGYDYALPGMYFVTAIAHGRARLLGVLMRGRCDLSPSGLIVRNTWERIPTRFSGSSSTRSS